MVYDTFNAFSIQFAYILFRIFASMFIKKIGLECVCVCVCVCEMSLSGFGIRVVLALVDVNLYIFAGFPVSSLWSISSFMPLWSEKMLDSISVFLNFSRLVLCPSIRSIMEAVLSALEKDVYSADFG